MKGKLLAWLDHRTGYRRLVEVLLIEHIPGGAKWRYVWGSCLAFVFMLQLITGVLLMTAYSPSDATAWSSVCFIQYEMDFGWLIRGLHHFGSGTMVVLLGLHMLQVVIAGAHLPPREVNWWLGMLLLGLVLAMSLTGYLLPWDQKGYWATQVATNIAGNLPGVGAWMQKVIVGGPAYGHHTLTRFYALHVSILPLLLIGLIVAHLTAFRRHGVTTPKNATGEGWFWPDQAFRDMVASLVIFAILLVLVIWGHGQPVQTPGAAGEETAEPSLYEHLAHAGREGRGANLDAPADPSRPYPARPEWYFLFLFQLLKYFEGEQELIGTVVIPNGAAVLLILLPLFACGQRKDGWRRRFGHVVGVFVVTALLAGAAALTLLAFADDMVYPTARAFVAKLATTLVPAIAATLVLLLAVLGLLGQGRLRRVVKGLGVALLVVMILGTAALTYLATTADNDYEDALRASQGGSVGDYPRCDLVERAEAWMTDEDRKPRKNAETFRHELHDAGFSAARALELARDGVPADGAVYLLRRDPKTKGKELFGQHCRSCHVFGNEFPDNKNKPAASDLDGFGTERWVRDLLREPGSPRFFGHTKLTAMTRWVERTQARIKRGGKEAELAVDFDQVAAWLGSHPRKAVPNEGEQGAHAEGYRVFEKLECIGCHTYKETGGGSTPAPDLTGYGDAGWVRLMLMSPASHLRYGSRNAMPAFRDLEGPAAEVTKEDLLGLKLGLLKELEDVPEGERPKKEKEIDEATKLIHLSDLERELIIRFLLKDYRLVFGGEPIAAPPPR